MATRDEVDELRALVERRNTVARWLGRTASAAVIAAGFLALLLIYAR